MLIRRSSYKELVKKTKKQCPRKDCIIAQEPTSPGEGTGKWRDVGFVGGQQSHGVFSSHTKKVSDSPPPPCFSSTGNWLCQCWPLFFTLPGCSVQTEHANCLQRLFGEAGQRDGERNNWKKDRPGEGRLPYWVAALIQQLTDPKRDHLSPLRSPYKSSTFPPLLLLLPTCS